MVNLKAGDRIECHLSAGTIVSAYNAYEETRTFEIVAVDNEGYYIYIPHFMYLNGGIILDTNRARRLKIASRFIGEKVIYIAPVQVSRVASQIDGCKCKRCDEFFMMAEPNQPDNAFLCWSCKNNPYR